MFTFNSPVIRENIWKIDFKTKEELKRIYYEAKEAENKEEIDGIIEFRTFTIYLNKDLDEVSLKKILRKKLVNLYLWETGQQDHRYTEEEFCDLVSVLAPLICKSADDILLNIKRDI